MILRVGSVLKGEKGYKPATQADISMSRLHHHSTEHERDAFEIYLDEKLDCQAHNLRLDCGLKLRAPAEVIDSKKRE